MGKKFMEMTFKKRSMLGVGLVEVMVALALGLFLLGGLSQIYLANKRSYDTAESLSRMQENLRFAAEMVAEDIRMAGFMPCRKTDKMANVLNSGTSTWWTDFFGGGVSGYDGDHTDDDTGADDHGDVGIPSGTTFVDHVSGTDIVTTLRGGESSYSVVSHVPSSAQFKLDSLHDLVDGDIILVCDLTNSAILQLTNANSSNVTLVHNTGVSNPAPGNATKGLGWPIPDPVTTNGTPYAFGPDSHLVKFTPKAYFIGTNGSGGRSLYRASLDNTGGTASMDKDELVEGIENMQILYGVDSSGNGYPNTYVRADQVMDVATWQDVVSVRIGLLAQTPVGIAINNDADTYTLAGTSVGPEAADRRQRYQYNTTIKIRNRGAM